MIKKTLKQAKAEFIGLLNFWEGLDGRYILFTDGFSDQPKVARVLDISEGGRVLLEYPAQRSWEELYPEQVLGVVDELDDSACNAPSEESAWETPLKKDIRYLRNMSEYHRKEKKNDIRGKRKNSKGSSTSQTGT